MFFHYKYKKSTIYIGFIIMFIFLPELYAESVSTDVLNVRSSPSAQSEILGQLYKGDNVIVLETNNSWSKISFENKEGWVSSIYLAKDDPPEESSNNHVNQKAVSQNKKNSKIKYLIYFVVILLFFIVTRKYFRKLKSRSKIGGKSFFINNSKKSLTPEEIFRNDPAVKRMIKKDINDGRYETLYGQFNLKNNNNNAPELFNTNDEPSNLFVTSGESQLIKAYRNSALPVNNAPKKDDNEKEENKSIRKIVKVGVVKKCPSCGGIIESFQARCTTCGHEMSDVEISTGFQYFIETLQALSKKKQGNAYVVREHYKLGNSGSYQWNLTDDLQQLFIETYVLPNNKDELLEYMIFFSNKIKIDAKTIYDKQWNEIWKRKCKYIYAKARLCLKTDLETLKIFEELLSEKGIK